MSPPDIPKIPSFTKAYHNKPTSRISPTNPSLSASGKTIVITGGGTGIGRAIGKAFAQASASNIVILGRRTDRVESAKSAILAAAPQGATVKVFAYSVDILDRAKTHAAFDKVANDVGAKIDVYISNAGVYADGPIATADADKFMVPLECNVRGALNAFHAFLPHAATNAVVLSTSSGSAHMKPMFPQAAYAASKAASAKLFEAIGVEFPELRVVQVQPGVVKSEMNDMFAMDEEELPAHFYVWLASDKAKFLKGKFVWANWDVDELVARAEEIQSSPFLLTIGLNGVEV